MKKAKRNAAIVISSSDDDEDFSVKSNLTHPKSKAKSESASVPRKNPKRAKGALFSASCPRPYKKASDFDEVKRFCEELDDDFSGIKGLKETMTCGLTNISLISWKILQFKRRRSKK
ncbi:hypothetical protein HAX54_012211 [Datura stramonium]|uniref:Uncharacterized protein n=1 Tax=Datura stramonium TaxID=4076 RepID=A0ABS8TKZ1_DATST|nr:hypothetical protein [Datura stramonium]